MKQEKKGREREEEEEREIMRKKNQGRKKVDESSDLKERTKICVPLVTLSSLMTSCYLFYLKQSDVKGRKRKKKKSEKEMRNQRSKEKTRRRKKVEGKEMREEN